ncbi:OLC1v1023743C1 [Oldenlandia corymbosa var. corymbosa]|uniref:OLC1v1023743C1 n=1 Tax=Oldenlandia corymbosa var. corymbosa TaxID=529605 RepID=A0AAV1C1K9_OLDCO|nr:OLC1v1023743C1 [Oldenlandia corymbosa var. corymbosa]
MAGWLSETTLNDLPDVILSNIIAAISDVRTRNAAALVCQKWRCLERFTRTSITLRGNIRDLFLLPSCFESITHLDLSLLSPWGHPIFSSFDSATLIAQLLYQAFPSVTSLIIYARDPSGIHLLAPKWPHLKEIKLVRWHQRPQLGSGEELLALFENHKSLIKLDLSNFYCWTDDVPAALTEPTILTCLNLMNPSFSEGFKSDEIMAITKSCPNLGEFRVACMFDPRYIGFVGDECLASIPVNCPRLSVLHLADTTALANSRADPEFDGFTAEDSKISVGGLIEFFSGLSLIEELVLDVSNNVRDSGPALEILKVKCTKLRSLKLGQFHGISVPVESKLDGVALCEKLESLSIRNVGDLDDMGLIAIGRGCWKLKRFEVQGCKRITMKGMRTLASLLKRTLVDVKISCCKNLNASMSLKALEPVKDKIQKLHIDCVWRTVDEMEDLDGVNLDFDLNKLDQGDESSSPSDASMNNFEDTDDNGMCNKRKRCRYSDDSNCFDIDLNSSSNGFHNNSWKKLQCLSLWISVGELLNPLVDAGLEDCPNLEEIHIKVEGDCREWSKHAQSPFGLSTLMQFPRLAKMHLDCGDTIGYAHTAPSGQMDLSQWERFYLLGIGGLNLSELDYWPPQDRDVNQRSLSLPAAGLLQQCPSLRKLFIHGTAHEHFLNFFLKIPYLRDFQLREDYYPAPENDMSTEMRADSLSRFEAALNRRQIID